jgi:hypothetical protein
MTQEDIKRMALESGFSDGEADYCQSIIIHLATLVAQQEREACANVAEQVGQHKNQHGIAVAIRARGQA